MSARKAGGFGLSIRLATEGVAGRKAPEADLGAYLCFEVEAGQGLRPPKARTWAPRGARPMVTVRGRRTCRVNIAGVVCFRPGQQPHLLYERLVYHGRKREPKSSTWSGYRDLIVATHRPAASNRNRYRRSCSAGVYPPLCAYRMPRPYTR